MGEAIGKWTGALFLLTMHFSVLHVMDTHSSLLYENPAPLYMALMSCELHTEITNGICDFPLRCPYIDRLTS